ncbi:MAG: 30S ribosomal protein S6 [Deltaproteobacteria bacterium]|nr:MAG: 30S ribosomal protein S6 [Deltaproteobacteria bacterium]
MRRYETIVIIDPDISDEARAPVFDRVKDLISKGKGMPILFDEWGVKKLAYEVKKKPRGYYVRIDYCGTGDLVNEMERVVRIDDRVLKYMTVLTDEKVDIENIKKEIAEAEMEKNQSAESAEIKDTFDNESDADQDYDVSDTESGLSGIFESEAVKREES